MKILNITQGVPCANQDGSSLRPFRCRPNNSTDFDSLFRTNRGEISWVLWPGTYRTQGAWAFATYNNALIDPNSNLVGVAGSAVTKIVLADDYVAVSGGQPALSVEVIIAGGKDQIGSEHMQIGGFSIDCSAARIPSVGLHVYSSGAKVNDVIVTGLTGKWGGWEGFGILVNDGLSSAGGGSSITGCSVELKPSPDSYVTGIYLGSNKVLGAPNVIRDCFATATVHATNKRAHAAFAANQNCQIINCVGSGFERFAFSDTDDAGDIEITNCRGDFGYSAITFPGKPPITYRRRIRIINSTFTNNYPTTTHSIFLMLNDESPAHDAVDVQNIDVDGVTVTTVLPPSSVAGQGFYVCSIQALKTLDVWIRNSTFPAGCQTTAGVYPPTPLGEVTFEDI